MRMLSNPLEKDVTPESREDPTSCRQSRLAAAFEIARGDHRFANLT